MNMGLKNQTAVVVGCARGIGRAIAEAYEAEGANVGWFDRDDVVLSLGEAAVGDVTQVSDLETASAQFLERFGRIDHVIYAVGCGSGKFGFPFWNLQPADWERVLAVNLVGAVNTAHVFAPQLIRNRCGSFQFLVSVAGQMGSQTDPPYSAAKAGLINFMQIAAKDLAPYEVRANAISPGMVKTELNEAVWAAGQARLSESERQSYDNWGIEKVKKVSPLGRWQEPAEFGAVSVFLASEQAKSITGQTINVDGGQVMHA